MYKIRMGAKKAIFINLLSIHRKFYGIFLRPKYVPKFLCIKNYINKIFKFCKQIFICETNPIKDKKIKQLKEQKKCFKK